MCVVSVVHDYGTKFPYDWWDYRKYEDFQELIRSAEKFDKTSDQPDCVDPEKQKFIEQINKAIQGTTKIRVMEQQNVPSIQDKILNHLAIAIEDGNQELIDALSKAYQRIKY